MLETESSGFDTLVETDDGIASVSLAAGSYLIVDLRNGTYYSAFGPVADNDQATLVEIGPDQPAVIEYRYASLSIRLRSPSGQPVVWSDPSDSRPMFVPMPRTASVHAVGDSVVVIEPLPAGDYRVGSDPNDPAWPATWYPSEPTYAASTSIRVLGGESRSIEIELLAPAFVTFHCPEPELPSDWSSIHCLRMPGLETEPDESPLQHCATASSITAGPFPAGLREYELDLEWSGPDGRYSARHLRGQVDLVSNDTTGVKISSVAGIEVVMDPADADLTLYNDDGQEFATAHGTPAILYAEPGLYRMVGSSRERWRTYWPRSQFFMGGDRLTVTDEVQRLEWSLVRSSTVRGRIRGDDGNHHPIGDGNTIVRIYGTTWSRGTQVDINGNFYFEGVWPDEYLLLAEPMEALPFQPTWFGNTPDREDAVTFTLAEGEDLHDLEIRLVRY